MYQHTEQVTRVRGADAASRAGSSSSAASNNKNMAYRPQLEKSDHLVLEVDSIVKEEVLQDIKRLPKTGKQKI